MSKLNSVRLSYKKFTPDLMEDYLILTQNDQVMKYITDKGLDKQAADDRDLPKHYKSIINILSLDTTALITNLKK
jgi:hypothetical protein